MASLGTLPETRIPAVRITGRLLEPATLTFTSDSLPEATLHLRMQPAIGGLPCLAHVSLGTHAGDHRAAEAMLRELHTGALVSIAGAGLVLRTDHHEAALRFVSPEAVLLLEPAAHHHHHHHQEPR